MFTYAETGKITSAYLKINEVKANDILGFIESKRSKDSFTGKECINHRRPQRKMIMIIL